MTQPKITADQFDNSVSTYSDLAGIEDKFDGMTIYVRDIDTEYVYDLPTNTWIEPDKLVIDNSVSTLWSSGSLSGFDLTDNNNGTITISSGVAMLRKDVTSTSDLVKVTVAGATFNITMNTTYYVIAHYNNGSPQLELTTSTSVFGISDKTVLWVLCNAGNTDIHHIDMRRYNTDIIAKDARRRASSRWIEYGDGITASEVGTRNLIITAGTCYLVNNVLTFSGIDSSGAGSWTKCYRNGSGGWTREQGVKQVDNEHYDDGSGVLADLFLLRYTIRWMFITFSNGASHVTMVLHPGEFVTLAAAQSASLPSELPPECRKYSTSILVNRVIVQQGDSHIVDISSPTTSNYVSQYATTHNGLAGLQGGESGNYIHLTSAQLDKVEAIVDGATKTEESLINGNIKINGTETQVVKPDVDTTKFLRADRTWAVPNQIVGWLPSVANVTDLNALDANEGDLALVRNENAMYRYYAATDTWEVLSAYPSGFTSGCRLQYASTTTITVNAGTIEVKGKVVHSNVDLTLTWSNVEAGVTKLASTVYYVYLKSSTSDPRLFEAFISRTAPTKDAYGTTIASDKGVARYHPTITARFIGSFVTDSSQNIKRFNIVGNTVTFQDGYNFILIDGVNLTRTLINVRSLVPNTSKLANIYYESSGGTNKYIFLGDYYSDFFKGDSGSGLFDAPIVNNVVAYTCQNGMKVSLGIHGYYEEI